MLLENCAHPWLFKQCKNEMLDKYIPQFRMICGGRNCSCVYSIRYEKESNTIKRV